MYIKKRSTSRCFNTASEIALISIRYFRWITINIYKIIPGVATFIGLRRGTKDSAQMALEILDKNLFTDPAAAE